MGDLITGRRTARDDIYMHDSYIEFSEL